MNRPAGAAADSKVMPFGLVLLEPVRSAEPPINSGSAGTRDSSANSEAARVAISFGVADSFSFTARTAGSRAVEVVVAAHARLESAAPAGARRREPRLPSPVRRHRALPGAAPGGENIGR